MIFLLVLALGFHLPPIAATGSLSAPALSKQIDQLFHTIIEGNDENEAARAKAEVKTILVQHGLPTVSEVGDQPAYEFVVLLASNSFPLDFRQQVLKQIDRAVAQHLLPSDAAKFYSVRLKVEEAKVEAESHPPGEPALRDEIEQMYKIDQAVRQQQGFDPRKLAETDRRHSSALQAILHRYGVPTYAMVGPQAVGDFIIMIQHQPARFRQEVLPKLKANVEAGQADPEGYALAYDRSQRDAGKKQLYGSQFECHAGEKLHLAPTDDEAHLNERRAGLGLMRIEFYLPLLAENMQYFCPPAPTKAGAGKR